MDITDKNNMLVEIKAGKTGYGILVESDGYVSRDLTDNNKRIISEALESRENGEWNVPNPFVLDVILQKYGIENANKRIYPEDVLKREVEKYQKLIDQRMALGECYKPDTEVFTEDGWKKFEDVNVSDKVLTLNLNLFNDKTTTNNWMDVIEYQKPIAKIIKEFDGELITIKADYKAKSITYKGLDDAVTPGHKYPVFDLVDNIEFVFREFVVAGNLKNSTGYIPVQMRPSNQTINTNEDQELEYVNIDDLEFGTEKYQGKVMCLEVPNHTLYVKCNGKSHWTGNCNHPQQSEIDLGRISHNIIECHWEGHTLVGKIEFNLTEGFRRYGICSSLGDTCANLIMNGYKIGVSSRGIGDVVSKLGKCWVNSFELVCFDIVATPSTNGAYIGNRENLEQYIESDESKKEKTKLTEKIEKIKNLL